MASRTCEASKAFDVQAEPLEAQMPSALVEVSFLSCHDEANRLATPAYRQAIAAGLYLGIINFIQSLGK